MVQRNSSKLGTMIPNFFGIMRKQKQTTPDEKGNPKKKSSFWKYVALIILILLFVVAYIIWLFLQKPVVADVRVAIKEPRAGVDKIKEQKLYQGKYLSFSYPGDYEEITHETPDDRPVKESIFLSALAFGGRKIAIVVEERKMGDFEESPSFQMRLLKPKEYVKESIFENGFKGFIFKKNTQVFEETAFVRKENFIISVSLSSPMNIEGLDKTLLDVLQSLEWRK